MDKIYNSDGSLKREYHMNRIQHRYKFLFPLKFSKEEIGYVFSFFNGVDPHQDILIQSNASYGRLSFLALLLKMQEYIDLRYYDMFSLTELWLGKDEDYGSLTQVNYKHMCLAMSNSDLPNKEHENLLLYLLGSQVRQFGSTRWLHYQGARTELKAKFPRVIESVENRDMPVIYIPTYNGTHTSTPTSKPVGNKQGLGTYF